MSDASIARIARDLAEAMAKSGYERSPEAKHEARVRMLQLIEAVRAEETAHEKSQAAQETPGRRLDESPRS
jgi:hypothetical protein